MESSQMTKALRSVFKKTGANGPVHHTGFIGKSAVSRCNNKHKEISGNLADLMAHCENTAQKYYRVLEKSISSVKASQKLHGITRNTEGCSEGEQQEQTDLQEVTENDTALQDEAVLPNREPWKEESINAIHTLFAEEIAAQNITISCLDKKYRATQYCLRKSPNGCMTESGRSGD